MTINAINKNAPLAVTLQGYRESNHPAADQGDWQLASGHWVPAKMPMRMVAPRTSTTSTYIYENWYTGMALDLPICVQGGAWPFYYQLTAAPSGMTIGSQYGDANYGRITWSSPTAGSHNVAVRVIDQDGNTVTHSWTLTVGTSKHVFFDAVSGNDSTGDGSIGNPYQTFSKFSSTDSDTAALNGKIAVYRTGTYSTNNTDALTGSGYRWDMSSNKPLVHMGYPGESVVFDFTDASWDWSTGTRHEFSVKGVTMQGINNAIAATQAFYFRCTNASRILFDGITFTQAATITAPTNPACIGCRDGTPQTDIAIMDCTFDGMDNVFSVELYEMRYVVFERNTMQNLGTLGGFYAKAETVADITCRANTAVTSNAARLFIMDNYPSVQNMEVCWNNMKSSAIQAVHIGQNTSNDGAMGWVYRNTIQMTGSVPCVRLHNSYADITMEGNVFVHDGTYTNGIQDTNYAGVLTNNNVLHAASTAYTDSGGALTGGYRASYLGLHGYEVS